MNLLQSMFLFFNMNNIKIKKSLSTPQALNRVQFSQKF